MPIRIAERLWRPLVHELVLRATGQRPIRTTVAEDVFLVGYPKSGNTWFQSLVAGLIHHVDPDHAPDALIQELVPDADDKRYFKRFATPSFFKTHALPRPEHRRVVYLLRDGRDAMVSYAHHLSALAGRPVELASLVAGEDLHPCRWHEHVEAWLANPYGATLLTIKYEDLRRDTAHELRRFLAFVGVETDPALLERVVAAASFERMRAREKRLGWENAAWPKDKAFVRRGAVGSFRDEMPRPVLEAFLEQAGPTLRRCGYSTAFEGASLERPEGGEA